MGIKSGEQRAKSKERRAESKQPRATSQEQSARSEVWREKGIKFHFLCSMLFALGSLLVGCATLPQKEAVLAVVEGMSITEGDLKYALAIAHRKEDLSGAGTLDIRQYIDKLVDDRLLMNEARNAGMDQYPEVRQAVDAYILRESVVKLREEEITRKILISEQEMEHFYRENYMRYVLQSIETDSEEQTRIIFDELTRGVEFIEIAQRYSQEPAGEKAAELTVTALALSSGLRDAVSGMKQGEISSPVKIGDKFYIVRLVRMEEPPVSEFGKFRGQVEKALRKQKEKSRSDEYLAYLRAKANITINDELLSEIIHRQGSREERKKWLEDGTALATVDGTMLSVSDFLSSIPSRNRDSREQLVERWVQRKLVDHEALSRHYEKDPDMAKSIRRYEDQLLKDTFIKRIIFPQIRITEETLKDYYSRHTDDFKKPRCYRIQQVTVGNPEEAEGILTSLSGGADFGWLAKRKSVDSLAVRGGDAGCLKKQEVPEPARDILDTLQAGEVSPVVQLDQVYRIYLMRRREGGTVEDFGKVKDAVYKACFSEQLDAFMKNYVSRLRAGTRIYIDSDEISAFENKLGT